MTGFAQKLSPTWPAIPKESKPPRQPRRGQSLIGVLDLPPLHRQVLTAVIRQGNVSTESLAQQGFDHDNTLLSILEGLREQGWLAQDAPTQTWHYQPLQTHNLE
jgi:hypothetical protein